MAVEPNDMASLRSRFVDLHRSGTFLMPNAWDVGSARILASLGFPAVATTSSGFAASLSRMDQHLSLDELVVHAGDLAASVAVPLGVDAEHCYSDTPQGVAETVERLAVAGPAGVSIEDYDPRQGLLPLDTAAAKVAAAAAAAHLHTMVLTARAENRLYGVGDLGDTITRLRAYRDAGADVVYAPGLATSMPYPGSSTR